MVSGCWKMLEAMSCPLHTFPPPLYPTPSLLPFLSSPPSTLLLPSSPCLIRLPILLLQLTSLSIPQTLLNVPPDFLQLLDLSLQLAHLTLDQLGFTESLLLLAALLDGHIAGVIRINEGACHTPWATPLPLGAFQVGRTCKVGATAH